MQPPSNAPLTCPTQPTGSLQAGADYQLAIALGICHGWCVAKYPHSGIVQSIASGISNRSVDDRATAKLVQTFYRNEEPKFLTKSLTERVLEDKKSVLNI